MELSNQIASGNTARVFLYNDKIVKVFNDSSHRLTATNEANKQRFAHSVGLPVPKLFDVTTIDGKQALIMEYVKGKTLGDLFLENKGEAAYYMNLSIDIQQKIHSIHGNSNLLEPMSKKLQKQIEATPSLHNRQKDALLEKMETITYTPTLCHGDFHLFNLILSDKNDQVTIIDWVDATAGDFRADIYRTYLLYEHFSFEMANLYLRLSCQKTDLSKEDIFQWAPIIAGARLSENVSLEEREHLLELVHSFTDK